MHALRRLVLAIQVLESVAELVTFKILVEQIWLLHNGISHGDVGVCQRHVEHVLAYHPEVHSLLQSIDHLEDLFVDKGILDLLRIHLTTLLDENVATDEFSEAAELIFFLHCIKVVIRHINAVSFLDLLTRHLHCSVDVI